MEYNPEEVKMIVRTACVPRMKAFLPLYTQTPKKALWPAAVLQHSTAAQTAACSKLPRLPVPKLENTIEKFLRSVQPFLSAGEFENSKKIALTFASPNGEGPRLQAELEDRAACMPNWLEDLWLQTAYLGYRDSVVINSSPGMMLPAQKFRNDDDRLLYTAKLIYGALQFHRKLYRHEIPQQVIGNVPQDMTQFYRVFGTIRRPALPIDKIAFGDQPENQSNHICVVRNNNFYKLPVMDDRGNPIGEEQILFMLRHVLDNTTEPGPPVGILSSAHRDTWANAYKLLNCPTLKDNKCSVSAIESSLFLVCLDAPVPQGSEDKRTSICHQLLHGGGGHLNSGNRWFDKCIQFIVGAGGEVGICYEHTPAEAVPVSLMAVDILKYLSTSQTKLCAEVECPRPIPLPFQVDNPIDCEIKKATQDLNAMVTNLDLFVYGFEAYGKNVPKKFKLSPDSFIQMAMQLAFYRTHCKPPPTYESASTRMFWGGRTETIRCCSNESKMFCELMLNNCATSREKAEALRKAIASHKEYTNEAMRGLGVDRHLLGLKLMAEWGVQKKLPEFFTDRAYVYSKKFLLSSSQVGCADECVTAFGPSEADGYGVCYNPLESKIIFAISSLYNCPDTSSQKYAKSLEQSLIQMQQVLTEDGSTRSKL